MDIIIGTLEGAIRDGITLLSKRRFNPKGPTYLLRPHSALRVRVLSLITVKVAGRDVRKLAISVRCETWGDHTCVALSLTDNNFVGEIKGDEWLLWGSVVFYYADDYPVVGLKGKREARTIEPQFITKKGEHRTMEYRLSTPVV